MFETLKKRQETLTDQMLEAFVESLWDKTKTKQKTKSLGLKLNVFIYNTILQ